MIFCINREKSQIKYILINKTFKQANKNQLIQNVLQ